MKPLRKGMNVKTIGIYEYEPYTLYDIPFKKLNLILWIKVWLNVSTLVH